MRKKLTDRMIASAKAPSSERVEYWDPSFPGFGLRVTPNGRKTFMVMYRAGGRKRRLTLGSYPALTLAKAREQAGIALSRADLGLDPADEKRTRQETGIETFGDSLDTYYASPAVRANKSAGETKRLVERDCRAWLRRPTKSIARRDVLNVLDDIVARGSPVMANRMHAYLSAFFSWAAQCELIDASPLANVVRPTVETPRERVLSDDELIEIWNAVDGLGYPYGPLVKLLMLTAQRRGEVAAMTWPDLVLDGEQTEWRIPSELTKNGRAHDVPLSSQAMTVIEKLPRLDGVFVFSTRQGGLPLSGWSKYKARLDQELHDRRIEAAAKTEGKTDGVDPIAPWTLHDLRRTAATGMARLRVAPHVVEKVLNHSGGAIRGVAAIYNRFDYADEKREALHAWARHVETIIGDESRY